MLSFAACLPMPQYTTPFYANATIWSGIVSYQCLNQAVNAPSLPCVCLSVAQGGSREGLYLCSFLKRESG